MKPSIRPALAGTSIALALAAQAHAAPWALPPGEVTAGMSQAEHAVRWWQWVNRVRPGVRAYSDPTGALCSLNQSGPVWFLAGTDGAGPVKRRCAVPTGKHLFLPVITMLAHSTPGTRLTCEQAQARVRENNDRLGRVSVVVDGVELRNVKPYRQASEACFDAFPAAPYLSWPQDYSNAATDGYWLMLRLLPAGVHRIVVQARYANPGADYGDLEQEFEYELHVQPTVEPAPPAVETDPIGSIFAMRGPRRAAPRFR